jgi:hypothetical protein
MGLGRRTVVILALAGSLAAAGCTEVVPELDPASVFEGVDGYAFPSLPPTFQREVQNAYEANPALAERVSEVQVRNVQDPGGQGVAVAMVLAVEPDDAADPGFEQGVVRGFSAETGSPLQRITIAGRTVYEGAPIGALGGTHVVLWREANLFVIVWGARPEADRAVAEAIIRRERSAGG